MGKYFYPKELDESVDFADKRYLEQGYSEPMRKVYNADGSHRAGRAKTAKDVAKENYQSRYDGIDWSK